MGQAAEAGYNLYMKKWQRWVLVGVVWLAFWLRLRGLFANTFHADEALFASWARLIAVWRDPLLVTQAVDKPPLLFYLQAVFYPLLGPVEWAARLPNFIASLLLVPLTGVFVLRMAYCVPGRSYAIRHTHYAALIGTAVVAFSPLAIQFSATAFTDPLLTFWLLAAVTAVVATCSSRPYPSFPPTLIASFLFSLALATKYQAVLFLPLIVGLGWLVGWRGRQWLVWLAGLLPGMALVGGWEWARTGTFSLWSAQVSNYGGLRLAWSWELWPRLGDWVALWGTAVPRYLLPIILLLFLVLFLRGWRAGDADGRIDILLILFVAGYCLLHWFLAVPIWDRYLLPILPIVAALIGRGVSRDWRLEIGNWKPLAANLQSLISNLLLLTLLFAALPARYGRYPVGGQAAADQGAGAIAQYLADAPYGTVLYDHWYSWQWRYHLFDKRVYVSWFPHAAALAENLQAFGRDGNPHYVALPDTAVSQPIQRAIREAGFQLHPIANEGKITLYQIVPEIGD